MGKIEDAIKKINAEIQQSPHNPYIGLVGEYIIDLIRTEADADKVLAQDKSLKKALKKIEGKAQLHAVGGVAAIEDCTVYGWAREYFGLNEAAKSQTPAAQEKPVGISLNLEDFM